MVGMIMLISQEYKSKLTTDDLTKINYFVVSIDKNFKRDRKK
jgi:hypothetical protein